MILNVITTRELADWIHEENIEFVKLIKRELFYDNVF